MKFSRAVALAVAKELCAALKPLTEKLIVAGSLRRRKAEVGDVEILYVPRFELRRDPGDLLGQEVMTNLVDVWLGQCLAGRTLSKRPKENGSFTWGEQNKLALHGASGMAVDFFQATAANWWTLLVCRTGSAEHNERICNAAIARGLKWDPYAGFRDRASGQLLTIPRSERAVFERVGLAYLEPWER